MNTPAHVLVGLAICARRNRPGSGPSATIGSLLPDLSLYVMAGVSLFLLQIPAERVFGELYFSTAWQTVFAIDNSVILWGIVCVLAWALARPFWVAFASAGLLHIATDFPLHHDDGRPHFWPISGWVFESPLSYWDSDHHAAVVAPVTLVAVLISAVVICRRWPRWWVWLGVIAGCLLEIWVVRQWLLFF